MPAVRNLPDPREASTPPSLPKLECRAHDRQRLVPADRGQDAQIPVLNGFFRHHLQVLFPAPRLAQIRRHFDGGIEGFQPLDAFFGSLCIVILPDLEVGMLKMKLCMVVLL